MVRWLSTAVTFITLVSAAPGCRGGDASSNSDDADTSGTGGSDAGRQSSTGGESSSTGGSGTGGSGGEATVTTTQVQGTERLGTFLFAQRPYGSSTQTEATAEFRDGPREWAGCTKHSLGPCYWVQCPQAFSYTDGRQVDAGTLGYTSLGQSETFFFQGPQYITTQRNLLWNSTSDVIEATATGGAEIPAFAISVSPPSALTLTAPVIPDTGNMIVSTSSDLALAWTGGAEGTAVFFIRNLSSLTPGITCEFPASDGAGNVPAIGLAALDAAETYMFFFYSRRRSEQTAGNWTIWVSALEYPTDVYSLSDSVVLQP